MHRLAEGRDEWLPDLWRYRAHVNEKKTYAGIKMAEFPEDLRTYEKIFSERTRVHSSNLASITAAARSGYGIVC